MHIKWFARCTLLVMVIGLFCAVGISPPANADDNADDNADTPVPRFESDACPTEINLPNIDCGWLIVPEDRSEPDSPLIRLAVAILRRDESNTPVVYLHGGPGAGALNMVTVNAVRYMFSNRDVILLDQRGSGYSEPSLDCPIVRNSSQDSRTESIPDREATHQRNLDAAATCRDFLTENGINIAAYHTAANAADVADLRVALGIDEWHLFGISYGTRVALTVMRDHPEGIGRVILDSVYPPMPDKRRITTITTQKALNTLFEHCASDATCAKKYPTLADDFFAQVERANTKPVALEMEPDVTYYMSGDDLVSIVFGLMYRGDMISTLPWVISEIANGDVDALLRSHMDWLSYMAEEGGIAGLALSTSCREIVPFTSDEAVLAEMANVEPALRPGMELSVSEITALCEVWDVPPADSIENDWVRSDIPTLLLTGTFDPVTPPAYAYEAAEHLTTHVLVEFPDMGHAATASACAQKLASRFLDDPTTLSEIDCVDQLEPPTFR